MKSLTIILLVAGAAVALVNRASAAEPLMSPRLAALRHDLRTVPGVTEDQLYRGNYHLQRGWFAAPTMVASGGVKDVDYVHSTTVIAASPRALATFPHLANVAISSKSAQPISVAPLK